MRRLNRSGLIASWIVGVVMWAAPGRADVLTADRAVQIALEHSTQVINAEAGVMDAKSSVFGAYSGVMPHVSLDLTRSGSRSDHRTGTQLFGTVVTPSVTNDVRSYSTSPAVTGSWSVLDMSALTGLSSARQGLRAAKLRNSATRQDLALGTRRQFYEVVRTIRLADVASGALRLARDDERRVRALFEVGSVSKSDVLKAQVRTAQSQLDSLTSHQAVINQRIALAEIMGLGESQLGDVDTVLVAEIRTFDESTLLDEASSARPDLKAAEAESRAARTGLRSVQFLRLPYVTVSGSAQFNPQSSFSQKSYVTVTDNAGNVIAVNPVVSGRNEADRIYSGQIALNWDIFTGFATESRIASARARVLRADESLNALRRNLSSEVHQALLAYHEAAERHEVSERAIESATENLKLTQQKYNVGSSTILDLIDAQVQVQRAQSDEVTAMTAIRNAEAQIDRVRGRAE